MSVTCSYTTHLVPCLVFCAHTFSHRKGSCLGNIPASLCHAASGVGLHWVAEVQFWGGPCSLQDPWAGSACGWWGSEVSSECCSAVGRCPGCSDLGSLCPGSTVLTSQWGHLNPVITVCGDTEMSQFCWRGVAGLLACANNRAAAAGACTEAVFLHSLQVFDWYTL